MGKAGEEGTGSTTCCPCRKDPHLPLLGDRMFLGKVAFLWRILRNPMLLQREPRKQHSQTPSANPERNRGRGGKGLVCMDSGAGDSRASSHS